MKLLVLAGGFGTRLQSVVSDVPKALAPVGDVSFIYLQLENWIAQGVKFFVFLLHHQADLIISFLKEEQIGLLKGCEIQWLVEPTPMDTGGAIAYAIEQLNLSGDFLVTNADTWLGTGIKELWLAGPPTIAVVKIEDARRYGNVKFDDVNRITAFTEKSSTTGNGWINAGLCHLNVEFFQEWNKEPFSLERISFAMLAAQGKLKALPLQTNFIDIGVPEDYFRFCRWIEFEKKGVI
jgi:D-glycero-alpha-D-manno-heptose 1-phosphate guanylyltransferase